MTSGDDDRPMRVGGGVQGVAIRTPARYRLTAPVVREHPIQKRICDTLRLEIAPPGKISRAGVVWWAIDHANYAGEVPGIRVGRGIIAGIADLFILYRGRAHHPEIKADDGVLSEPQKSVAAAVLAAGGRVAVVRDENELLACIDEWGIPRNHRVRVAA
jgi:hypothetical protein